MRPRIILRTHYQADEPRFIIATVTRCSSPTESRHEDAVAAALKKWALANGYTLSLPGATYAVGNARTLELLNDAHRWTSTGLALGFLHGASAPGSGEGLALSEPERRLYLKQYLAAGGALLVQFAAWLLNRGETSDDELRTSSVIEQLLLETFDRYLGIVTDIRERTAVRKERERLSRSEYASSTKRHKRYPLLRTMERLELLANRDSTERIAPDPDGHLAALVNAVPDLQTLERIAKEETLYGVVERVYGPPRPQRSEAAALIERAYSFAIDRGLQACPLGYLDHLLFALSLVPPERSSEKGAAEEMLEPLHRRRPLDVRFHVDRRGRRAFVLVTGETLNSLAGGIMDGAV